MGIYNIKAIQEVYFGNTKGIEKLQTQLSIFRARCFKENKFSRKENTYEELTQFNRIAEEVFGFKTFALQIHMADYTNAFTLPVCGKFDINKTYEETIYKKDQIKFNKDAGYSCLVFMTYRLFMDKKYTDREIMAIILHEIGHNFSEAINKTGTAFNNIKKSIIVYDIIMTAIQSVLSDNAYSLSDAGTNIVALTTLNLNKTQSLYIEVMEKIKKNHKNFLIVMNTISRNKAILLGILKSIIEKINITILLLNPIRYLRLLLGVIIKYNPIQILYAHFGYNEEKTSDTFATMHGYGADLSSALYKMHYSNKDMKIPNPANHIRNLMYLPIIILSTPTMAHPETITRIKEQISYLEKELEMDNMDKKMRKEVESQIKEMNQLIDERILKPAKEFNVKDPDLVNKLYALCLYNMCGGDIREFVNNTDNHSYIKDVFKQKIDGVKMR